MPIRENHSGRIQPIEGRWLAAPGTCAICTRPPRQLEQQEVFANPMVEIALHGDLYFCQECCAEIAAFIGSATWEEYNHVRQDNILLTRKISELSNQFEYLRSMLDARISAASSSEPVSDGPISIPLFTPELDTTELDRIINEYESEPVESGKDN